MAKRVKAKEAHEPECRWRAMVPNMLIKVGYTVLTGCLLKWTKHGLAYFPTASD